MYKLVFAKNFWKKYRIIVKKNNRLKKKIVKTFELLALNPRHSTLKSHKVATKKFGEKWASKITGNLRIIWDYDKNKKLTILILSFGGHSGKQKVYK